MSNKIWAAVICPHEAIIKITKCKNINSIKNAHHNLLAGADNTGYNLHANY
jgi:hypothetical protein